MCSINHEKKAIFIHIPKTAGCYIRSSLSKYYGFNLYLGKRNDHDTYCQPNKDTNCNTKKKEFFNFKQKLFNFCSKKSIFDYYKTSESLNELMNMDEEKWNSYFKFCFVRNPYDRIVSGWNYICQVEGYNIEFSKYLSLKNVVTDIEYCHVFLPQSTHIFDNNNQLNVDYIGKFENLEEDFCHILKKIGFSEEEIVHNNKRKLNQRKHESFEKEILNQKILDEINGIYKKDFDMLHYKQIDNIHEINDNDNNNNNNNDDNN